MPVSVKDLAKLRGETRDVDVEFSGVKLRIQYRPNWQTLAVDERIATLPIGPQEVAATFCEVVSGWDLTNGQEKAVPITMEAIREHEVPIKLLRACIEAIWADAQPPKRG